MHMSQEMSNFMVRNKKTHYTNEQSYRFSVRDKHIFKKNDSDHAMFTIMDVIKGIRNSSNLHQIIQMNQINPIRFAVL